MPEPKIDLFEKEANLAKGRHIYTVSEITQDIKILLENTFVDLWVEGELSSARRIPTGTVFFSLKDNNSLLKCVMFASYANTLKFELKDGSQLLCFGRVGVYEKDGQYQLYVQKLEPKGIGSLQLALEQLKQKLEKEGLFSPEHKRPIPYLPSRIGVVTSLQGAAIKDILKVLERRFKDTHIIVYPVRVQGDEAKQEIAQAIKDFNAWNQELPPDEKVEVLIVGRGGGSIEDLWAFNEEIVARAIYNSKIPIISAVGHERDWTVADLVADVRAPTPSVAAELVIPKKEDLEDKLKGLSDGLKKAFSDTVTNSGENIDNLLDRMTLSIGHTLELNSGELKATIKKLTLLNPAVLIPQYKAKMLDLAKQAYIRAEHLVKLKHAEFLKAIEKLSSLSPLNILSRGYSITFANDGRIIKDIKFVKTGDSIKTKLHKGDILSEVKEILRGGS